MTESDDDRPERFRTETLERQAREWPAEIERLEDHLRERIGSYFSLRERVEAAKARLELEARLDGRDPDDDDELERLRALDPPSRKTVEDQALRAVRTARGEAPNRNARARLLRALSKATGPRPLDRWERKWFPAVDAACRKYPGEIPPDLRPLVNRVRQAASRHDAEAVGS